MIPMEDKEKSYLLPMDRELHTQIKIMSTRKEMSMKDYIIMAIENEIERNSPDPNAELVPRESQVVPNEDW